MRLCWFLSQRQEEATRLGPQRPRSGERIEKEAAAVHFLTVSLSGFKPCRGFHWAGAGQKQEGKAGGGMYPPQGGLPWPWRFADSTPESEKLFSQSPPCTGPPSLCVQPQVWHLPDSPPLSCREYFLFSNPVPLPLEN